MAPTAGVFRLVLRARALYAELEFHLSFQPWNSQQLIESGRMNQGDCHKEESLPRDLLSAIRILSVSKVRMRVLGYLPLQYSDRHRDSSLAFGEQSQAIEKSATKSSLANRNSFDDKANCY